MADIAEMTRTWERISTWLSQQELGKNLLKPAQPDAQERINKLEADLGVGFSDQLKHFFLLHGGTDENSLVEGLWALNSLEDCRSEWRTNMGVAEEVGEDEFGEMSWYKEWIPIAADGAGNSIAVNVNGGALMRICYDGDVGASTLAPSLADWLEIFAGELEAGKYSLEDDNGYVKVNYAG